VHYLRKIHLDTNEAFDYKIEVERICVEWSLLIALATAVCSILLRLGYRKSVFAGDDLVTVNKAYYWMKTSARKGIATSLSAWSKAAWQSFLAQESCVSISFIQH